MAVAPIGSSGQASAPEGEGQYLAEVIDGDAIAVGNGGEVISFAQCIAPGGRPCPVELVHQLCKVGE